MKLVSLIILCALLASCVSKPVFISDLNATRIDSSTSTHLERIVSEKSSKDISLGVAVLVGIDEGDKSYIALAPGGLNSTDLQSVNFTLIRTLKLDQAKELLRVINYSIKNYDSKMSKLESINANYQSALQGSTLEFQGMKLAPITTDNFTYTFVNIGRGSEATIDFGASVNSTSGIKKLNKEKLELLSSLLTQAIHKVESI